MSFNRKGLVLALEDDEVIDAPAEVVEEVEVVASPEVEETVAEVAEGEGEVVDLVDDIDSATDDVETLDKIETVMADSVADGGEGLSQPAAEIAEIAIESICNRLGVKYQKIMPAMESFGSTSSRAAATRISMEGVKDLAKKVLDTIVKAINWLWEKMSDLVDKIVLGAKAIKGHAVALYNKVKAVTAPMWDKVKEVVTSNKVYQWFAVKGTMGADAVKNFINKQMDLLKSTNMYVSGMEKLTAVLDKLAAGLGTAKDFTAEKFAAFKEQLLAALKSAGFKGAHSSEKTEGNNSVTTIADLPNGDKISIKSTVSADPDGTWLNLDFEAGPSVSDSGDKTVAAPSQAEAEAITKQVEVLQNEVEAAKSSGIVEKTKKALLGSIDKMIAALNKFNGGEEGENAAEVKGVLKTAQAFVTQLGKAIATLVTKIYTYCVNTGKMALTYIQDTYRALTGKKDEAAPAAAEPAAA